MFLTGFLVCLFFLEIDPFPSRISYSLKERKRSIPSAKDCIAKVLTAFNPNLQYSRSKEVTVRLQLTDFRFPANTLSNLLHPISVLRPSGAFFQVVNPFVFISVRLMINDLSSGITCNSKRNLFSISAWKFLVTSYSIWNNSAFRKISVICW